MKPFTLFGLFCLLNASLVSVVGASSSSDASHHHGREEHEQSGIGEISAYSIFHLESKWLSHDGKLKSLAQALSGKPTVGAMVYTTCEHACPLIVNDMLKIEQALGEAARDVQFALFSMDPKQDKPKRLEIYRTEKEVGTWDLYVPEFQGSELELAIALGIRIKPLANGEFAHSNTIFVLDSGGTAIYQQNGLGLSPADSVIAVRSALVD